MNKSNIEAGQPEQQNNNEPTAQNQQFRQPNANTNVVGIPFNSREIKFRVWDEDNSIMLHDDGREQVDISFYGGKPAVIHHFEEHTIERDGIEMDVPVSNMVTDFILMQYIGLKDKNGKEIYEGDIVRQKMEDVVCKEGFFYWYAVIKNVNGCWVAMQLDYDYSNSPFHEYTLVGDDHKEFEVVGNIFENPELLQTL